MSSLKSAIILSVVLFTTLYAIKDGGLHLNEAGQYELRRCLQHAINHM
jgi:hypothetical protein